MKYFRDFTGNYFITENGGIGWRRNPQDGHGGHSEMHHREMEQIAEAVLERRIAELIPEIQRAATEQAYSNLLEALSFDVTSAVNIGFENGEAIFRDSKTQKVIADAVMREVRKQLKGWK